MARVPITVQPTFAPIWQTKARYVISMGGRGSGRSYEGSQVVTTRLLNRGKRFRAAIMRAVHADIRKSIYQEIVDRINGYGVSAYIKITDNDMKMTCGENSVVSIGFKKSSGDRTAKMKSLAGFTTAFIEEAEEIGEDEFQKLDDSLRAEGSQIFMQLNTPDVSHWIIMKFFDIHPAPDAPGFYTLTVKEEFKDLVCYVSSDHRTNTYLTQEVHDRYESYRNSKPSYYWNQIRGYSPEVRAGKIYNNFRVLKSLPFEARLIGYALDWGFSNDECAVSSVYNFNGGYIFKEEIYQVGLDNQTLASSLKLLPYAPIVADSSEPKSIDELQRYGLTVIPVQKGKGSVEFGIRHMQSLPVSVIGENYEKEVGSYCWKMDKDGNQTKIPTGKDHLLDGARYFAMELIRTEIPENYTPAVQQANDDMEFYNKYALPGLSLASDSCM